MTCDPLLQCIYSITCGNSTGVICVLSVCLTKDQRLSRMDFWVYKFRRLVFAHRRVLSVPNQYDSNGGG